MTTPTLKVGDRAPDFTLPRDGGGTVRLSELTGQLVVLYFYPKDDTSTCTQEAISFSGEMANFAQRGAVVMGVSRDSIKSHDKFRVKYTLTTPLLSDEPGEVCASYGVWVEKQMYGRQYMGIERSTFLIDQTGVIKAIWSKVKVKNHVAEVLDTIDAM